MLYNMLHLTLLQTETPNTHLSVVFECTPSLRGRITPLPHYRDLYILDFVSSTDGRRFEHDTNLDIYDIGVYGEKRPRLIYPLGSILENRGTVDLYALTPGRMAQIRQRDNQQLLKTISFTYSADGKIVPRIE